MSTGGSASLKSPNILLIMTDQQRYDSLGCYGFEAAHTPNLDRLADDGALFERCYVTNPICTPSRASMFTGKHLPGHGVHRLHNVLPDDEVHFTQRLQDAGYRTALFGKMHTSGRCFEESRRHPTDGFDIYEWCLEASISLDSPLNGYARWLRETSPEFYDRLYREGRKLLHIPREHHMTHWAAERMIDYIRGCDGEQPFFCMMSVFDPHNPYEDYPLEMLDLIDVDKIPDPLIIDGEMAAQPEGIRRENEHSYLGAFDGFSLDDLRKMRVGYHASIALIDLEVGRVLATLRERGLEENTLVIFCSDHGDMLGDHSLLVKGAFFFDPNVRVPMIMRWPNAFGGGARVKSLVGLHDVAATVLAAAGLAPEQVAASAPDASDLVPLATGDVDRVRDYAVTCHRNSGISDGGVYFDPPIHATMFRDERYKLSVFHGDGDRPTEGTLYDMVADPDERNDLWGDAASRDIRLGLTSRLADWLVAQEQSVGRADDMPPDPAARLVNAAK